MRRRSLTLAALALVLSLAALAGVAAAQDWAGDQAFLVTVTDDAGRPAPEVQVVVRLAEPDRSGGPPALLTNEDGVAEVAGLAAGEWEVELTRQGFMVVTSYLRLQPGKRPQVGFTSSQRTGSSWAPMKVSYSGLGAAVSVAQGGSAREMNRAGRRAERRAKQREHRLQRGDQARIVESPAPAPAATTDPPAAPGPVESPTSTEAVEQPKPVPEPREAPPEPEPASEPVRLLPDPTLLPAGACPECAPGEWSVSAWWSAQPRAAAAAACAPDLGERLERAAAIVYRSLPEEFHAYAGALASPEGRDALGLLPPSARAEVQQLLVPVLDPERSCQVLGILLPNGAQFVGFQYEAADLAASDRGARARDSLANCLPDQPCAIGAARWQSHPVIHRHAHGTLVYGVFENLSPDRPRQANLVVYFRPPRNWLPPR